MFPSVSQAGPFPVFRASTAWSFPIPITNQRNTLSLTAVKNCVSASPMNASDERPRLPTETTPGVASPNESPGFSVSEPEVAMSKDFPIPGIPNPLALTAKRYGPYLGVAPSSKQAHPEHPFTQRLLPQFQSAPPPALAGREKKCQKTGGIGR